MTFSPFNSHTNQLFINLKLLKVREVVKLHQLKLVYDFQRNQLPDDLMSLFKFSSEVHTTDQVLNSSANKLLYIPSIKTKSYGNLSIRYFCPKLWNTVFKSGFIQVNADCKKSVKLSLVISFHHLKNVLKKHYLYEYSLVN